MTSEHLIKNHDELCNHGEQSARKNALDIIEEGILRAIPYQETKRLLTVKNNHLSIGNRIIDLNEVDNIYVLGVGKGAYPIALAIEEALGARITDGIVLIKQGDTRRLKHIELVESGHPLPNQEGLDASLRIRAILKKAKERDLVLAPITGGSSAMMNILPEGISLKDLITVNDVLLKSGASISKMNAVRKHLCDMKGGRFVEHANPAEVHTFTLNTATPEMLWPDLVNPDPTTFSDAISVLKNFNLWEAVPESIRKHLTQGLLNPAMETPKTITNANNYIHYVADPVTACQAMADKAREMGYSAHILSTALEGEASSLGIFLAGITNETVQRNQPFTPPFVLISGGETTVTIGDKKPGVGGPNQETALGYVSKLFVKSPCVCISLDSDGTDGPTEIAGGIVDNTTGVLAQELNISINQALIEHDSSKALVGLGDAIITGHTGTNIMNLRLVLIERAKEK